MKKIIILVSIIVFSITTIAAQEIKPFSELTKIVQQKRGWFSNRKENAMEFHKERKRLGKDFRKELLVFIRGDIPAHYNTAMFLSLEYYLNGEKPDQELALLIFHQGLVLIKKSSDQYTRMQEIAFRVFAAILSQKRGYSDLAVYHKSIIVKLLKTGKYGGTFPAITKGNREMYNFIKVDPVY